MLSEPLNEIYGDVHVIQGVVTSTSSPFPGREKEFLLTHFYCSTTRSVLEYACQVFHSSLPYYLSEELERIQKRALRIIFPYASYNSALKEAGIPSLYDRRASLSSDLFNDIVLDINHKLAGLLPPKAEHHRQLRSNRKFYVPVCKTDRLKKSFIVSHSLSM